MTNETNFLHWPWFVTTLGLSAWLLLPTLNHGFNWDHGVFQYVAWRWAQGLWPYVHTWDIAYPGSHLLHLLIIYLGGTTPIGIRVLDFLVQFAVAGLMVHLGSRLANPRAGLLAALLYFSFYAQNSAQFTAARDAMLVLPMFLLVACLWWYWSSQRRSVAVAMGLVVGVMSLIRPTYGLLAIVAGLGVLLVRNERPGRERLVDAVFLWGGSVFPLFSFFLLYAAMGAVGVLRDHVQFVSGVYGMNGRFPPLFTLYRIYDIAPVAIVIGSIWSLLAFSAHPYRLRNASLLALLALCILARLAEGKAYGYQLFPVFSLLALLAGVGWDQGLRAMTGLAEASGVRRSVRVPLAALAFLAIFAGNVQPFVAPLKAKGPGPDPDVQLLYTTREQAPVARYLREHTPPQSRIQGWGVTPGLFYAAKRHTAGRFIDFFPFLCEYGPLIGGPPTAHMVGECDGQRHFKLLEKFVEEYLNEVGRADYFVAHYQPGSIAVTVEIMQVPDFPRLREILEQEFEPEITLGKWTIFRNKAGKG